MFIFSGLSTFMVWKEEDSDIKSIHKKLSQKNLQKLLKMLRTMISLKFLLSQKTQKGSFGEFFTENFSSEIFSGFFFLVVLLLNSTKFSISYFANNFYNSAYPHQ